MIPPGYLLCSEVYHGQTHGIPEFNVSSNNAYATVFGGSKRGDGAGASCPGAGLPSLLVTDLCRRSL